MNNGRRERDVMFDPAAAMPNPSCVSAASGIPVSAVLPGLSLLPPLPPLPPSPPSPLLQELTGRSVPPTRPLKLAKKQAFKTVRHNCDL